MLDCAVPLPQACALTGFLFRQCVEEHLLVVAPENCHPR